MVKSLIVLVSLGVSLFSHATVSMSNAHKVCDGINQMKNFSMQKVNKKTKEPTTDLVAIFDKIANGSYLVVVDKAFPAMFTFVVKAGSCIAEISASGGVEDTFKIKRVIVSEDSHHDILFIVVENKNNAAEDVFAVK